MVTKTICLGYRLLICQPAALRRRISNTTWQFNSNLIRHSVANYIHTSTSLNKESKDYYQTLGVSPNASTKEIRDAYVEAAKKTHPDRHGVSDIIDGFDFVEIQEAYEVLSDKKRRNEYDSLHRGYTKKTEVKDRYKSSVRSWNRVSDAAAKPERDYEQDSLKGHYKEPTTNKLEGTQSFITLAYTIGFVIIASFLAAYGSGVF